MASTTLMNSRSGSAIRSAVAGDRQAAAGALARAFWDDPFLVHFYPDEAVRARRVGRFFDLLWRVSLPLGHVDVTDGCEAVALWRPPDRWRIPRRTIVANLPAMLHAYGSAVGRVFRCLATMEKHHPRQPHWYLGTVGTDPAHQGSGHAGRLIRSRLERCDAAGEPAYLEAATESLIPFYGGLGFRLVGKVTVPDGPSFYPMWRDPAPTSRKPEITG
jgi:GNAT superfamily N-acetyltransferase